MESVVAVARIQLAIGQGECWPQIKIERANTRRKLSHMPVNVLDLVGELSPPWQNRLGQKSRVRQVTPKVNKNRFNVTHHMLNRASPRKIIRSNHENNRRRARSDHVAHPLQHVICRVATDPKIEHGVVGKPFLPVTPLGQAVTDERYRAPV